MSRFIPTVKVEVAFDDNDLRSNMPPTFTDITPYVMSIQCKRGYNYETGQLEAGTASLKLNNSDRRFDSTYPGSPYVPWVVPLRKIRISAEGFTDQGDVGFGLDPEGAIWTGYVERWPSSWDGPVAGFVDITCVDLVGTLNEAKIAETFAEERTDQRVNNVLDNIVDYSYGMLTDITRPNLGEGLSTVTAATFTGDKGALEHIREVMVTEGSGSAVFLRSDGTFTFMNRWSAYRPFTENPADYTVPTFTDGTLGADRYPYHDLRPAYDVDRIRNQVTVTSPAGSASVEYAGSLTRYGPLPLEVTTLHPVGTSAEELTNFANWELVRRKEPVSRFESMVLRPTTEAMWAATVLLEISAQLVVERTFPGHPQGDDIVRNMLVESIEHRISHPGTDWEVTFGLATDLSAETGAESPWFILGSSELSDGADVVVGSELQLGTSRLAY